MRSQNIPVSDPMLKEKALSYARQLQIADFKGSDGWLDRWKTRHGITFKTIGGEASSSTQTASWSKLPCQPFCQATTWRTFTTLMSSAYSIKLSLRSRSTLSLRNVWEGNIVKSVNCCGCECARRKTSYVCDWKAGQVWVFLWSA